MMPLCLLSYTAISCEEGPCYVLYGCLLETWFSQLFPFISPQPPLLSALYCFILFYYYYYSLCLTVRGSLFSKISTPSSLHHGCHLYFNPFRLHPSFQQLR
ncbi:hypothetical protein ACN38_g4908 [Penicillium nordicum]|uniref:Uncharacterized protein n=1 Tax=Penicillium nordicum TaxID=229535 RepID=A0A0M8PBB2_9EURO|nr:hypothetical protein ACN38_g4908 [Penicillium nordicum]